MKKLLQYALLAIMMCGFVACSNSYVVRYNTSPIGAHVVCGDEGKGLSPLTLYYELEPDEIEKGIAIARPPCKAIFVSGYEEYFQNEFDINKFPNGFQAKITRPKGKGYRQDMQFGLKHQQTLIMQRQAQAAEAAASAAQQQMRNQQFQYQNQSTQQQRTKICNTFGNITMCN